MKPHTQANKLFIALLIAMVAISPALAFLPDQLGDAQHTPNDGGYLTAAGVARQCQEIAYKNGIFVGSKAALCGSYDLANIYSCVGNDPACQNGWKYIKELDGDVPFSGTPGQYYAYECYSCNGKDACQANGAAYNGYACQTDSKYVSCTNGVITSSGDCSSITTCDPNKGQCVAKIISCVENWHYTSDWSICNAQGKQYIQAEDSNACGTFKYAPVTERTCTPPVLTTNKVTFKNVKASSYDVVKGNTTGKVTISATVTAPATGLYLMEAGTGVIGALSQVTITENQCNPAERWYSNKLVTLTQGENTVNWEVYPLVGRNAFWVAQPKSCGGEEILVQTNSVENIIVRDPAANTGGNDDNSSSSYWIYGGIVALVAGAAYLLFRK